MTNYSLGKEPGGDSYENTGSNGTTSSSGYVRQSYNDETGTTTTVAMNTQHDHDDEAESHAVVITT